MISILEMLSIMLVPSKSTTTPIGPGTGAPPSRTAEQRSYYGGKKSSSKKQVYKINGKVVSKSVYDKAIVERRKEAQEQWQQQKVTPSTGKAPTKRTITPKEQAQQTALIQQRERERIIAATKAKLTAQEEEARAREDARPFITQEPTPPRVTPRFQESVAPYRPPLQEYEYTGYRGEGIFIPKEGEKPPSGVIQQWATGEKVIKGLPPSPAVQYFAGRKERAESGFQQQKKQEIQRYLVSVGNLKAEARSIKKETNLDPSYLVAKYPNWNFISTKDGFTYEVKEQSKPQLSIPARDPIGEYKQAKKEAGWIGLISLFTFKASKEYLKLYPLRFGIGAVTQIKSGAAGLAKLEKVEDIAKYPLLGALGYSAVKDPLGTLAVVPEIVGGAAGWVSGGKGAKEALSLLYQPRIKTTTKIIKTGKKGDIETFRGTQKIFEYDWLKHEKLSKILPEKIKMRDTTTRIVTEVKPRGIEQPAIKREVYSSDLFKVTGKAEKGTLTIGGKTFDVSTDIYSKNLRGYFNQMITQAGKDKYISVGKGSYLQLDPKTGKVIDITKVRKVGRSIKIKPDKPYFAGEVPLDLIGGRVTPKITGVRDVGVAGIKITTGDPFADFMPKGIRKGLFDRYWKGLPATDSLAITYIPKDVPTGEPVDIIYGKGGRTTPLPKDLQIGGAKLKLDIPELKLDITTPSLTTITKGKGIVVPRMDFDLKPSKATEDYMKGTLNMEAGLIPSAFAPPKQKDKSIADVAGVFGVALTQAEKQAQRQFQRQQQRARQRQKKRQDAIQTGALLPIFDIGEREKIGIMPRTDVMQRIEQQEKQAQKQMLKQMQTATGTGIGIPTFGFPPPPTTLKPPFIDKKKRKQPKKVQGWFPFGKSKGKMIKLSHKPMSKRDALSLGSFAVDNTTSATFRIKKTKKKIVPKKLRRYDKPFYFSMNAPKFRNYRIVRGRRKPLKNTYIEKRGLRIDTRGELQGLTMAKLSKSLLGVKPRKKKTTKKRRRR